MPGTILVSVLEFKNILSTSLWVSMGKRAYQTWDKGDFSFPLTTFRENLVVRIEDAEGNEISRTEVETLLIVEKGYWDDLFQLEGGYVHMKLQFILTEDDRNRIRDLRESALKKRKKQDKVPAANVEYSGTGIPSQDSVAPSMPIEMDSDRSEATSSSLGKEGGEIQYAEPYGPSAKKLQTQLIGGYISVKPVYEQDAQCMSKRDIAAKKESLSENKIDDPSFKPEDQSAQSMLKVDFVAKKEYVSQNKIVDSNKPEDWGGPSMLNMDVSAKKESVSQKKIVDPSPEMQRVLEKTPSSVRKMISAFETGLSQKKGRRSLTRTRASKSQPNLAGIGCSLIDVDPEDTAMHDKTSALRLERPLTTGNSPAPQRKVGKRGKSSFPEQDIVNTGQPVFHEQLKQLRVLSVPLNEASSSQGETLRSVKKESNAGATSYVDLMRLSNLETFTRSERINVAHKDIRKANIIAADQDCPSDPSVPEKQKIENRSETLPENLFERASNEIPKSIAYHEKKSDAGVTSPVDFMRVSSSQRVNMAHSDIVIANNLAVDQDCSNNPSVSETLPEIHFERALNEKPKSIAYCENKHYDFENSGVWIFPDNRKDLCITTAGKNIVHLLEDCHIGVDDHQRKKRPMQEVTGKRGFFHIREKTRKSESGSSGNNGSSGPIRQVIKIAVIVGFGIFVLLTRQKENRRGDRKSKDGPDFMDQLASSDDKWSLLTADGD